MAARREHVQAHRRRAICVPSAPDSGGRWRSATVTHATLTCACCSIGGDSTNGKDGLAHRPEQILPCPADRSGPSAPRDRRRRVASAPGRGRSNPAPSPCPDERARAVNSGRPRHLPCRPWPGHSASTRIAFPGRQSFSSSREPLPRFRWRACQRHKGYRGRASLVRRRASPPSPFAGSTR